MREPGGGAIVSLIAALLGSVSLCGAAGAQPPRSGVEFQVNTHTTGLQNIVDVAMNDEGDFIVVWESSPDGFSEDVFAQRFDHRGVPQGGEFRVNNRTFSEQEYPAAAIRNDGSFVVTWGSNGGEDGDGRSVLAQRFASGGSRIGRDFVVNGLTTSLQGRPTISMDSAGGFFIAWEDHARGGSFPAIAGRFFGSAGNPLGPDFRVSTGTGFFADVARSDAGDLLVAWSADNLDGSGEGILAQRFASSGERMGVEFQVNQYTQERQLHSTVSALPDGFIVVWHSRYQDGDSYGIFARRVVNGDLDATVEFQVPTRTLSQQSLADVAADSSGDFVVTWGSYLQDGSQTEIFAQRFDSTGTPEANEFQVNGYTPLGQIWPAVAVDRSGNMVVAWMSLGGYPPPIGQDGSQSGIFAQRFGDLIPFDVDRDGSFGALTDALMLLRFAFGMRGPALVAGAINQAGCNRCSADAVEEFIEDIGLRLDIDGDGQVEPLTDGLLAMRWAFGLRGTNLTNGAVAAGCTRCTAPLIGAHLTAWAD